MAQLKWDHEFHMEEDALGDDVKVFRKEFGIILWNCNLQRRYKCKYPRVVRKASASKPSILKQGVFYVLEL